MLGCVVEDKGDLLEVEAFTLGSDTVVGIVSFIEEVLEVLIVLSSSSDGGDGKLSFLLSRVANLVMALNCGSPASNEGQMVEGGCFNRVTKSVAVC